MTGDQLLASVKTRASIPVSQATLSDQDILDIANYEMISYLFPLVIGAREEYNVTSTNLSAVSDDKYRIPYRAFNQVLRHVSVLDSSLKRLTQLTRLASDKYEQHIRGFYIEGSYIYLWNVVGHSYVELKYVMSPSKVTKLVDGALVSSYTSTTITLSAIPSSWTSPIKFDIIRGVTPFDVLDFDRTGTISGNIITITDGKILPSELTNTQDYIHLATMSPFVNAPPICEPLLAQRVAVKCLESLGALDDLAASAAVLNQMQKDATSILTPRVQGQPQQIIADNTLFTTDPW